MLSGTDWDCSRPPGTTYLTPGYHHGQLGATQTTFHFGSPRTYLVHLGLPGTTWLDLKSLWTTSCHTGPPGTSNSYLSTSYHMNYSSMGLQNYFKFSSFQLCTTWVHFGLHGNDIEKAWHWNWFGYWDWACTEISTFSRIGIIWGHFRPPGQLPGYQSPWYHLGPFGTTWALRRILDHIGPSGTTNSCSNTPYNVGLLTDGTTLYYRGQPWTTWK